MTNEINDESKLNPDEVFELLKKEDKDEKMTLADLAKELNIQEEKLYDMYLDEISELSFKISNQKFSRIKDLLKKRDDAFGTVRKAQIDAGITNQDITTMYFEEIKEHQ